MSLSQMKWYGFCFSLQFPNCVKCNRKFDFTHRRVMKQLLKTDSKLMHYTITFANPLCAFQQLKFMFDYEIVDKIPTWNGQNNIDPIWCLFPGLWLFFLIASLQKVWNDILWFLLWPQSYASKTQFCWSCQSLWRMFTNKQTWRRILWKIFEDPMQWWVIFTVH